MNQTNPKVEWYFKKSAWPEEMAKLRTILLAAPLTEELKWGKPCYTFAEGNVAILQGFKATCAVLFPKGALLKDPKGLLEKPGEHTQAARRMVFTGVQEIVKLESVLKGYIGAAIEVEKAGLEVTYKTEREPMPEELQRKLEEMPTLKKAFKGLTPGRQRAYILHFSSAKQSQTRETRIEKCIPRILNGEGFNER